MHKAGLTKSNPRGPQTEKGGEPSAERNRPPRARGASAVSPVSASLAKGKTLSQSVSPVIISLFHHGPAPRSPLHVVRCSIRYNGSRIACARGGAPPATGRPRLREIYTITRPKRLTRQLMKLVTNRVEESGRDNTYGDRVEDTTRTADHRLDHGDLSMRPRTRRRALNVSQAS